MPVTYYSINTDTTLDVQAIVVFVISIHAYAYEKSEMEEVSLVALSGCIWLQAFVMTLETKYASFLYLKL